MFIALQFLFPVGRPVIETQPEDVNVGMEGTATFTVVASGEGLMYQWFGPGGEIAGATSATLQISNVQSNDAGSYRVRVSNAGGSVISNSITLTISKHNINSTSVSLAIIDHYR